MDSINQHDPKPHGAHHYVFVFFLKITQFTNKHKHTSIERERRHKHNRRDIDVHAKIDERFPEEVTTEMRSEGEEKQGRERCGWGSRYSRPAEEAV